MQLQTQQEKLFQKFNIKVDELVYLKDKNKVYKHLSVIDRSQKLTEKFKQYRNIDVLIKVSVESFLKDYSKKLNSILGKAEFQFADDVLLYLDSIAKYYNVKKHQAITVEEFQKDQAAAALVGNVKLVNYLINKELALRKIKEQEFGLFGKVCNFFFSEPRHVYLDELLAGVALSGDVDLFKRVANMYRYQIGEQARERPEMRNYTLAYAFRSENIGMIDCVRDALALSNEYVKTSLGALLIASGLIHNESILNQYEIVPYEGIRVTNPTTVSPS